MGSAPVSTHKKKRTNEGLRNPASMNWGGDEPPETGIHTSMLQPQGDKEAESAGEMLRLQTWCNPTCKDPYEREMTLVSTPWPPASATAGYTIAAPAKVTTLVCPLTAETFSSGGKKAMHQRERGPTLEADSRVAKFL